MTDVIVVGTGPAGATIARLLSLRGFRVAVVGPTWSVTERLEILSPSSAPTLEALGLGDVLKKRSVARPCAGICRRWGSNEREFDDFLRHPGGKGFVIDRAQFDANLQTLAMGAGASFIEGKVVTARRVETKIEVVIRVGNHAVVASAPTVVDASGRPAALARRLGAQRRLVERLVAEHYFSERSSSPCQEPVWLEVKGNREGWSYSICGPDGRKEQWTVYRGNHRGGVAAGQRANASSACLMRAAGSGWLAIGDAATCFDPITCQGLVNALATALVAAGAIISSRGLPASAASAYADVVDATFSNSERGRMAVYEALELVGRKGIARAVFAG